MRKIKEWGNNGRSMGGGFVGGSDNSQRAGSFHSQKFYSEPYSHADTLFNQKTGLSSSHFKGEYYEDQEMLEDEEEKELIKESSNYEMLYRFIIDLIMLDDNVPEEIDMGTLAAIASRLATNSIQLALKGRKARKLLSKQNLSSSDIEKLKEIRSALGRDCIDMITTITSSIPVTGLVYFDMIASQMTDTLSDRVAYDVLPLIEYIPDERAKKLLEMTNFIKSLRLIIKIDERIKAEETRNDNTEVLNESEIILAESMGIDLTRLIIDIILAGGDTGNEAVGAIAFVPRVVTNAVQLAISGRKARKLLAKSVLKEKEVVELKNLREKLGRDCIDMISAVIALIPTLGDGLLDILLSQMTNPASKFLANMVIPFIDSLENETAKKILNVTFFVKSLRLIQEIDERLFALEQKPEAEQNILECRVYKNRKYCLVETLEEVRKASGDDIAAMNSKLNSQLDSSLEEDEDLNEFSGVGAIGGVPSLPLGYNSRGKKETKKQRKARNNFNKKKSFPYRK